MLWEGRNIGMLKLSSDNDPNVHVGYRQAIYVKPFPQRNCVVAHALIGVGSRRHRAVRHNGFWVHFSEKWNGEEALAPWDRGLRFVRDSQHVKISKLSD